MVLPTDTTTSSHVESFRINKKKLVSNESIVFDRRFPYYLGDWTRSLPGIHTGLAKDDLDEPHIKRKLTILKQYPEIKSLYGCCHSTFLITIGVILAQLLVAFAFSSPMGPYKDVSWFVYCLIAFFVGGTITQLVGIIIHEATHDLIFKLPLLNRLTGLLVNLALPIPIAMSFRRYHLDHHAFQGVQGKDPDLPLNIELVLVKGNPILKLIWLSIYPFMYLIRGLAMKRIPQFWELINLLTVLLFDSLCYYFGGWSALGYLFLSLWFGYSFHPAAAHFIQEHYTWVDGQETTSYYGILNKLFMNIGYHVEHHDFSHVPWSSLDKISQIAPEYYYSTYTYHTSWLKVFWDFITLPTLGPQSRLERSAEAHKKGRKTLFKYNMSQKM